MSGNTGTVIQAFYVCLKVLFTVFKMLGISIRVLRMQPMYHILYDFALCLAQNQRNFEQFFL